MALVEPEQRVPVGLGLHHRLAGDHLARAGPVLDEHLLTEALRQFLRDHARGDVGDTARAVRQQDPDRLSGIVLRERRPGAREQGQAAEPEARPEADADHGCLLLKASMLREAMRRVMPVRPVSPEEPANPPRPRPLRAERARRTTTAAWR